MLILKYTLVCWAAVVNRFHQIGTERIKGGS